MMELLSKFDPGQLIGLTAVVGGFIVGTVASVMGILLAMRKNELDAGLKRAMLERGMSAEEICMVIDTGSCATQEHAKQPAYREV